MTRMLWLLLFVVTTGCKVSAGVFVEKDWQTDNSFEKPDLRTKLQFQAERNFNSWDEVLACRPGEKE